MKTLEFVQFITELASHVKWNSRKNVKSQTGYLPSGKMVNQLIRTLKMARIYIGKHYHTLFENKRIIWVKTEK